MKYLLMLMLAFVVSPTMAQTASMGPLYVNGRNAQGYPIFMLRCSPRHCVGLRGREMGSLADVARYMSEVKAADIEKYRYRCRIICWDRDDNIIGRPSTNYRDPYAPAR